jgi:hypothetical protein
MTLGEIMAAANKVVAVRALELVVEYIRGNLDALADGLGEAVREAGDPCDDDLADGAVADWFRDVLADDLSSTVVPHWSEFDVEYPPAEKPA